MTKKRGSAAEATIPDTEIEKVQIERLLPVPLTEEEKGDLGLELARTQEQLERQMLEAEADKESLKYALEEVEARIRSAAALLRDRKGSMETRAKLASRLALAYQERETLEARVARSSALHKAARAEAVAAIRNLTVRLTNGYELRDVDCDLVRDFTQHSISIVRLDTGEVVEMRPMEPAEAQRSLPMS